MKIILFTILIACSFTTFSQSNFTVFNNGGQSFYVILNGIKQNSLPQTNVVVSGLKNSAYSVKLIFADGKTADIDKNFFIENPSDITTRIIFKKGKGKLQLISMEPTAGISNSTSVITYRPDNSAIFSDAVVVPVSNSNTNSGTITTVETTTTQTTTTNQGNNGQGNTTIVVNDNTNPANVNMNISTNATPTNGNISMNVNSNTNTVPTNGNVNMNVGVNTNANQTTTNTGNVNMNVGVNTNANQINSNTGNVNMNVGINETNTNGANVTMNVTDPMSGQQMNVNMNINATGTSSETNNQMNINTTNVNSTVVTSTNTTTTTSTTGNSTGTTNINQGTNSNTTNQNTTLITGNKITCNKTLNNLEAFIVELNDQSFEGDRAEALELALVNTCLYTAQAEKLVDLFTFSEYKLSAAKFMSDRLMDRDNATALAKHFNFEADKMEYRRYISGKN